MKHVSSLLPVHLLEFTHQPFLGRHSPPPDPHPLDPIMRIRALRYDPALRLSCTADTNSDATLIYADDQGYHYHVDRADGWLVKVDRREDLHSKTRPTRPEARLPVAELRTIAIAIVETQRPSFNVTRATLHPFEGNRDRELYLFRWEDFSLPLPESRSAPYIEVGLYADGQLARYTDTIKRKTKF